MIDAHDPATWHNWLNELYFEISAEPSDGDYDTGIIECGSTHYSLYLHSMRWHKFGAPIQRAMLAAFIEYQLKTVLRPEESYEIVRRAYEIVKLDEAYDD